MKRKEIIDEKVINSGVFNGLKKWVQSEKDFSRLCENMLPEILDRIHINIEASDSDVEIKINISELVEMFKEEGYSVGEYGECGYKPDFYENAEERMVYSKEKKNYIYPMMSCLINSASNKRPHKTLRDNIGFCLSEHDIVKKIFSNILKQSDEYKRFEGIAKTTYGSFYRFLRTCEYLGIRVENKNFSTNIWDALGIGNMGYRLIPDSKKMLFKTSELSQTVFCMKIEKVIPGLLDGQCICTRSIKNEHRVYGMFDDKPYIKTQKMCEEGEKLLYDVAILSQKIGIKDEIFIEVCNDKIWLHSSFFRWELTSEAIDKLTALEEIEEVFNEEIITKEELALIGPLYKNKSVKEDAFIRDVSGIGITEEEAHCLFMEYGNIIHCLKQKDIIESWSIEAGGYSAVFTSYGEKIILSNRKNTKPDFSKYGSMAFISRRMPQETMELIDLLCSKNCKAYSKIIKKALDNIDIKYLPILELKVKRGFAEEELGKELYNFIVSRFS